MNTITADAPSPAHGLRALWNRGAGLLQSLIGESLIALAARVGVAGVFFLSGRTKVDGLLTVNETALYLFSEDYALPFIAPVVAAHLATYAEHLFPVMLVLGLGTRFAALSLLAMIGVIQVFVYPAAWPTHLTWAAPLLYLAGRGAGRVSLDHLFRLK